ncbi:MAG TPA: NAD(P)-dependent oxidoreductase [Streptosporangiaceae bacterium]|nr:NAD(P)-dependent oxidoreductase [Streptosporangiaceae bacterium]
MNADQGGVQDDGHGQGHRLGWLGTGRMGQALIRRLLAAGCDVTVYNRTKSKAEPLAEAGAKVVDRASDLAGLDIVFVTVGTSDDLVRACTGPDGLVARGRAPAIVIDCSTVAARDSERIRAELAGYGSQLLAAPVMGNPKVASVGRLTFAVSGPAEAFETARPYLELLGAGATYVGEGELARTVKLCHNLFLGTVIQSLTEVTVLAERAGISRQALLACLNSSVLGSTFSKYKTPALVNLDFHPTFTATLLRKDFDLGLASAREHEVPMPVASTVYQLVQSLVGNGFGEEDFAALLVLQARSAGLELASENAEVSDGLTPASGD